MAAAPQLRPAPEDAGAHDGARGAREVASPKYRWNLLMPHRAHLVALARRQGAGPDAEDVVDEALIAASQYVGLDETRVRPFLICLTTRRVADLRRQAARDHTLCQNRTLMPPPSSFEQDVLDRAEAHWVLTRLAEQLPPEITTLPYRHHLDDLTWNLLAAERGENVNTLKTRVHRFLADAVRRVELTRQRGYPERSCNTDAF